MKKSIELELTGSWTVQGPDDVGVDNTNRRKKRMNRQWISGMAGDPKINRDRKKRKIKNKMARKSRKINRRTK